MVRIFWMIVIAVVTTGLVACGDDDAGDYLDAALAYDNEIGEFVCACFWAEDGYASEQECLEWWTFDDQEISEVVQCSRDAMADVEAERPESVDEYFSCSVTALDRGTSCVRSVNYNGRCNAAAVEMETCDDETWGNWETCIDDIQDDEEAEKWFLEWEDNMDAQCPEL